jgi:hypothetical protein
MTDTERALTTTSNAKSEHKSLMPSGKVRTAVDLMIWSGTHRDAAAKAAGLTPKSLYNAFRKHHVRQYYLAQLEVLRTSAKAKTFHRLEALADQDENRNAAVAACKVILTDEAPPYSSAAGPSMPGFVIIVPANEMPSDGPVNMANMAPGRPRDVNPPVVDMMSAPAFKPRRPSIEVEVEAEAEPAERQIEPIDPTAFKPPSR